MKKILAYSVIKMFSKAVSIDIPYSGTTESGSSTSSLPYEKSPSYQFGGDFLYSITTRKSAS